MRDNNIVQPAVGQRIVIVGTTGVGKTSLASKLAQILHRPHIELDALYWQPNWQEAKPAVFREHVTQALQGDAWIADGNYSKVRDIVWNRADSLVWLDYSLVVIMKRLMRRTLKRAFTQEELWNGNRESFRQSFFSKDSLFWWALTTFHHRRASYAALLSSEEFGHLAVNQLRSPRETEIWFQMINLHVSN